MAQSRKKKIARRALAKLPRYEELVADLARLIDDARRTAARSVNSVMTATYWIVGRRIVEAEQAGRARAGYGEEPIERLSGDLTARFGRGFGRSKLFQIRAFFLAHRDILQTASGVSSLGADTDKVQTASGQWLPPRLGDLAVRFPLPWSHYVRLLAVKNEHARAFYEHEALRGGWTVRQLDRQIQSQFYERTALSKKKTSMLRRAAVARPEDAVIDTRGEQRSHRPDRTWAAGVRPESGTRASTLELPGRRVSRFRPCRATPSSTGCGSCSGSGLQEAASRLRAGRVPEV
jgi:hypothetical protein